MARIILLVFYALIIEQSFCHAQTVDQQFHSEIHNLYSFHPGNLSQQERESKSAEMDKFWKRVESDKETFIPLLRKELADQTNPSFFFYDGSQLLLKLSKEKSDKLICIRAIARCDLNDVQHSSYLYTIHGFAKEDLNTAEAALHILAYPTFKAFFPQHSLTLAQNYSFLYMLLPVDESFYVDSCIARLKTQNNDTSKQTLIMLLWYTVTKEGDQAINNILSDASESQLLKDYARELHRIDDKIMQNESKFQSNSSYFDLKRDRIKALSRISDEALYELDELTMKIRFAYNRIK